VTNPPATPSSLSPARRTPLARDGPTCHPHLSVRVRTRRSLPGAHRSILSVPCRDCFLRPEATTRPRLVLTFLFLGWTRCTRGGSMGWSLLLRGISFFFNFCFFLKKRRGLHPISRLKSGKRHGSVVCTPSLPGGWLDEKHDK
jgi:hypothetical protein